MPGRDGSRRLRALALATLIAVVGTGCAAGGAAEPTARSDGDNATVNGVQLRNIFILGPPPGQAARSGGAVPLYMWVLNESGHPDRLVSAAAVGTARSLRIPGGAIDLPVGELVHPQSRAQRLVLRGLLHPLRAGEAVRVTFEFERAGAIDVTVPVMPYANFYTTYPAAPPTSRPGTPP